MSGTNVVHKIEATPIIDKPPEGQSAVYQPDDDASAQPAPEPEHDADPRLDADLPDGTEADAAHDQPEQTEGIDQREDEQVTAHADVAADSEHIAEQAGHEHAFVQEEEHGARQENAAQDATAFQEGLAEQEQAAYRGSGGEQEQTVAEGGGDQVHGVVQDNATETVHAAAQEEDAVQQEPAVEHNVEHEEVVHEPQLSQEQSEQHNRAETTHPAQHENYSQQEPVVEQTHEPHTAQQEHSSQQEHATQQEHVPQQAHVPQQEHAASTNEGVQQDVVVQHEEVSPQEGAEHEHPSHQRHVAHQEEGAHLEHTSHDHVTHHPPSATHGHTDQDGHVSEHLQNAEHVHSAVPDPDLVHRPAHTEAQEVHEVHEHQPQATEAPQNTTEQIPEDHAAAAVIAAAAAEARSRVDMNAMPDESVRYAPPVPRDLPTQGQNMARAAVSRRVPERYHPSAEQLKYLVEAFEQAPTPSAETLNKLSETIHMPMHNLVLWFKNRRARQKKKYPSTPSKTGKRSYVRSGVYSRNPPKRKEEERFHPSPNVENTLQPPDHPQHGALAATTDEQGAATPPNAKKEGGAFDAEMQDLKRSLESSEGEGGNTPKRRRFTGVAEVLGDENPCRNWDSRECHRRCMEFFAQNSRGSHLDQTQSARLVASKFFFAESQTGLTLTSAMQSLESSVEVLDEIVTKVSDEGHALTSGSRVLLREFLAQIRSGKAVDISVNEEEQTSGFEDDAVQSDAVQTEPVATTAE